MDCRTLSMMTQLGLRLVAVVLLAACGAGVQLGRPESDRWLELGSPHFRVSTDLPEPSARVIVQDMEDMRAALLACAWPGAKEPRGHTRVLIFRRPSDFDRYTGLNAAVAGVLLTRPRAEPLLAFSPGPDGGVPRVAVHELAHDLSQWFLPIRPAWLSEGLAVYLEGIRLDRSSQVAVMGEPSKTSLEWLKETRTLMSTSRLFAGYHRDSIDWRDSQSFYAASWYLVSYLINTESEAFARFQQQLVHLTPWKRAWEKSFPGLTPAQLDTDLIEYSRKGESSSLAVHVELPVFEPTLRTLSAAQAHGARALFASSLGKDIGMTEMAEALRLDPDELDALTVRFNALSPNATAARADIASRAIRAQPRDGQSWLLAAQSASTRDERRPFLEQAQRLDPDHPGVAALLAEDELARGNSQSALGHVRLALRRSSYSASLLAIHVAALAGTRHCDDAASLAQGSEDLFGPDCQVSLDEHGNELSCAALVRSAYETASARCGVAAR